MHIAKSVATDFELRRGENSGSRLTKRAEDSDPTLDLQEIFSNVLHQVGRPGFASVEVNHSTPSNESDVSATWASWFDSVGIARYRFEFGDENPSVREGKTAEDLKNDFGRIMVQAYQQGGYASPLGYLRGLAPEDLKAIQQVQHLADPIDTTNLSDESALNLLLPPDAQVDANKDGLTAVGAANTIRFPDSNTPQQVREAWEHATADLSERERMMRVLDMKMPLITANLKTDADGTIYAPSSPAIRSGRTPWLTMPTPTEIWRKIGLPTWIVFVIKYRSSNTNAISNSGHRFAITCDSLVARPSLLPVYCWASSLSALGTHSG